MVEKLLKWLGTWSETPLRTLRTIRNEATCFYLFHRTLLIQEAFKAPAKIRLSLTSVYSCSLSDGWRPPPIVCITVMTRGCNYDQVLLCFVKASSNNPLSSGHYSLNKTDENRMKRTSVTQLQQLENRSIQTCHCHSFHPSTTITSLLKLRVVVSATYI